MNADQLTFEKINEIANNGTGPAALAELTASLSSGDDETNALIVDVLRDIDSVPEDQAAKLVDLTRRENAAVAAWACKLLAKSDDQLGAEAAIAWVLQKHPNDSARQEAACALGGLQSITSETRSLLEQASESDDPRLARLSERALQQCSAS